MGTSDSTAEGGNGDIGQQLREMGLGRRGRCWGPIRRGRGHKRVVSVVGVVGVGSGDDKDSIAVDDIGSISERNYKQLPRKRENPHGEIIMVD